MSTLVHIGYHKTGTTWLQKRLFACEETGFAVPWTWSELMQWLVLQSPLGYDREATRAFFAQRERQALDAGRVPVASAERLSGDPFSGGLDSARIAQTIHDAFPDARILIVFREQRSVIQSIYKQYVRDGGPCSLRRFLRPARSGSLFIPQFRFEFYTYDRLVALYRELFGSDRVLTIPFEIMRQSLEDFACRVADFAGVRLPQKLHRSRDNPALSPLTIALKRRINFLLIRSSLNPGGPIDSPKATHAVRALFNALDRAVPDALRRPLDRRYQRIIEDAVLHRYRESNRRLQSMTPFDLAALGYDC